MGPVPNHHLPTEFSDNHYTSKMAPTILIVGATGNTGRGVVETLPKLIGGTSLSSHRILALTRNTDGATAQALAKLPGVELVQQNWVEIDEHWLRDHEVERVFIASHNLPSHFAEEGQFLVNALRAKVAYVVRISTTAANVHPDFPGYYPRTHWAIETMLAQPEFKALQWTSLQPNGFASMLLTPTAEFIKSFRKTGKQSGPVRIMIDASTPTAIVDSHDVGIVAAHLLAQDDTARHDHARYVVNGPEDVTGEQIVALAEKLIGEKVQDVRFKDTSVVDQLLEGTKESRNVIGSIRFAPTTSWAGMAGTDTGSKEVVELYAPKRTAKEVLEQLTDGH